MGQRDKPDLIPARREVDPAIEQAMKDLRERRPVPFRNRRNGPDRLRRRSPQPEERPEPGHLEGEPGLPQPVVDLIRQQRALAFKSRVSADRFHLAEGRQAGSHPHRVGAERAGLVDRSDRSDQVEQLPPSPITPHRKTAPNDLAVGDEVRDQPQHLGHPAHGHPKPGDDLVEDHQTPVRPRQPDDRFEELPPLNEQPVIGRQRFEDHRGDPLLPCLAILGKDLLDERFVIERRDDRLRRHLGRDPRARGGGHSSQATPRLDQQRIDVAMIAPFELEDAPPPRRRARDAEGAHDRLRPRGDEPQLLNPRNPCRDPLGQGQRVGLARPKAPRRADRLLHLARHLRIAMAENQRTKALAEIEVLPPLDRTQHRSLGPLEEDWRPPDAAKSPHRTVYPARGHPLRPFKERLRRPLR